MKPTVLQIVASDGPRVQGIDIQMKKVARIPLFPQTKTESQTDKEKNYYVLPSCVPETTIAKCIFPLTFFLDMSCVQLND